MSEYTHYSMSEGMPLETHGPESGMLSTLKSVALKAKNAGQEIVSRVFAPSQTDQQIARLIERGHEILDRNIDEAWVEGGTYDQAVNAYIVKDICAHIDSDAIIDKLFGLDRPPDKRIVSTGCPAATAQPE